MDHQQRIDARRPRIVLERRTLDIAKAAAHIGARVRARAESLTPAELDRRAERLTQLRIARRRD